MISGIRKAGGWFRTRINSRPEGPGRQLRVMTGGPAGTEDHDDKKARTENVSKGKVPVTTRDLLLMMRA